MCFLINKAFLCKLFQSSKTFHFKQKSILSKLQNWYRSNFIFTRDCSRVLTRYNQTERDSKIALERFCRIIPYWFVIFFTSRYPLRFLLSQFILHSTSLLRTRFHIDNCDNAVIRPIFIAHIRDRTFVRIALRIFEFKSRTRVFTS